MIAVSKQMFQPDDVLPHMQVKVRDLAPRVLVAGDPARVERIAAQLDGAKRVGANREYVTYTGQWRGVRVSVSSHGVGSAGAAIVFTELGQVGVERVIRVGTAGGMQPTVRDGDLVVATAAVREDGLSRRLVPLSFPAVVDLDVATTLRERAARSELKVHSGIVLTTDNFYPSPVLDSDMRLWQRAGIVAVEMEVSALLVTAALYGVAAGAILAIDGNPLADDDEAMADYQPFRDIVRRAVDEMITVGLDALIA